MEKEIVDSHSVVIKKPNYMLMSLHRIIVLSVIMASVIVVVYYTPMPEEYFENCDRECHELDWPMICRVKLVIEVYKTLSKSCNTCIEKKGLDCPSTCITADGRERGVLSANRELPAPALHVCQNDILVVDVVHRAPAHALSIHWRGQPQKETPFMDGAPMLTQCPQPAYTTFQYKFRASAAGTHMYHAHSAADAADGLSGAFIVRQSPRLDPLRSLYDVDRTEHTIVVSEWGHSMGPLAGIISKVPDAESLLINGKGNTLESPNAPLANFAVEYGKRYRFRLVYGGGAKSCPIKFSIEQHALQLVALDGHSIQPEIVDTITMGRGERADFILKANKPYNTYKMRVIAESSCQENLEGLAQLVYKETEHQIFNQNANESEHPVNRDFTTINNDQCSIDSVLCLDEVHSASKITPELGGSTDEIIYVPFNYSTRLISANRVESWGHTDGHRFTYPASPLLTQNGDVTPESMCTKESGHGEECVHIKTIPLDSTVEIVMYDQVDLVLSILIKQNELSLRIREHIGAVKKKDPKKPAVTDQLVESGSNDWIELHNPRVRSVERGESDHIFHLHGYSFRVIALRQFSNRLDKDQVAKMNEDGTLFPTKNLVDPVVKDTIVVPKLGVVALRFKADNPGFWMMRDERSSHWTRGLDFVLKVGNQRDFVQAPADFPKCGSYVGPEYFLI